MLEALSRFELVEVESRHGSRPPKIRGVPAAPACLVLHTLITPDRRARYAA